MLVTPAQIGVEASGEHYVAGVVGVVEHEVAQRTEMTFDGIGPGAVGRGEAQLDAVLGAPVPDRLGLVGREIVQDDVDGLAVGAGGPTRLDRRQGV